MTSAKKELDAERAEVTARLWEEFERLNTEHGDGRWKLREIRLSTRKQYGGYYQKMTDLIVLSWPSYKTHGWDETLNTFRHEVAHIAHQDHSRAFWQLAIQLGCTRRYALPPAVRKPGYTPYLYECPRCHAQVAKRRRLILSSCGKCDRKFNPLYLLRLISSPAIRAKGGTK